MEEQKVVSKEVKMNVSTNTGKDAHEAPHKLTYDELNQACADMSQQLQNQASYIQKVHKQMQQMEYILQNKRVDYLFKVVELASSMDKLYSFNGDFVQKCIDEIEESLTIPEQEGNTEKEE